jgi:UDP-galactopyranose mutase
MSSFEGFPVIVVGSGFFGSVIAYSVATQLNRPVLILEKRSHFGGNSFSELDSETGIEYHRYGSHLFHTSNERVWKFVNQFSKFNNYRHRVFSLHKGRMYTMPINLMTINNFFRRTFSPSEAREFVQSQACQDRIENPSNLEEKAISLIGRSLYEAFVQGYTQKQWETDPRMLPAETISRLPVRFNYNDFYFSDLYEGLPLDGYAKIFERMLSSPNIRVELNVDYFAVRKHLPEDALVIYTGPLDRFYDYRWGTLGWRTLDFEIERPEMADYQGAAVVNYPDPEYRFTRIHEFKHLHTERPIEKSKTLIMREYSRFAGQSDEPYYPIGTAEDKVRYERYSELAKQEKQVLFGGRLGTYRYLDMHQAIAAALKCFTEQVAPRLTGNGA